MSTFIFENLISEKIISSSWGLLNLLYPAAAGVGLNLLLNRLLKPRFGRPWLTAAAIPFLIHLATAMVIGWEPGLQWSVPGTWLLWYPVFLLLLCSVFYKGPAAAKLYLAVTFCTFYLLTMQTMEHLGYILFQMALHAELPPGDRELPVLIFYTCPFFTGLPYPDSFLRAVLYNSVFFISLAVACVLILISSRCLAVKLKRRTWEMKWKEVVFLLLPAGAGISFYIFINFIKQVLFETAAVELVKWYGPAFYLLIPALTLGLMAAVLYSCDIYEQLLVFGEEKGKADMLENQVEQMEGHIQDIERLYTGIRSMKHDMQNYLFDIRSLLSSRGIRVEDDPEGLGAYFSGIGEALDRMNAVYHTGNPVTDVVINEKYRQARSLGAQFTCSFRFPEAYRISAFDISIILNNALNNALEACERLKEKNPEAPLSIQIEAYCKNNVFLMEITNTFDGILKHAERERFLMTRKEDPFEHGLGFQNIRRCAEKYFGTADYRYSEDRFYLTVMLQRVWKSE